jgi:LacI family transcriptional regulator
MSTAHTPGLQKQQFTLRDVAALAGVSLKTASRVLNNEANVKEHTAELVRNAMRRLAYRPNEVARSLKGRRSGVIGIVAPVLSHEFVAACIESMHHAAQTAGKSIILMLSDGNVEMEREQISLLLRRQVEGLIILPAGASITPDLAAEIGDTPTIVIDNPSSTSTIPSILIPNREMARQSVAHLLGNGYGTIALVGGKPNLYTISERIAGARAGATEGGVVLRELIFETEEELTDVAMQQLLAAPNPPRAILTLNSYACEQVLHATQRLKLRIPEELALMSFDDFRLADVIAGGITVVSQPTKTIGTTALKLLLDIQAGIAAPEKSILHAPIVVRRSTLVSESHSSART